jgi:hypothetical protein
MSPTRGDRPSERIGRGADLSRLLDPRKMGAG